MTGKNRKDKRNYSCGQCGKISYLDRGTARLVARRLPNRGLHVYACPDGNGWHCGHLPARIVAGHVTRADVYPGGDT